ncbi:MAG: 7-carboxy-7-deazaguanine synthase QueE [Flavobacteriales bacterium]|nr:7-carboxy-7-deazaguanine synthase QueE [Flavobacteriales bacterium]
MSESTKIEGVELPVMEQFLTIQGEGYHSGRAAYFIRLGGCDVGCVWCDVKESWAAGDHPILPVNQLVNETLETNANFVVITGGEPAMYPLDHITKELNNRGIETAVETSGAYELSGNWHWICFSPKKFKAPVPSIYEQAHELKIIVFNIHDLKWAEEHASKVNENCKLYLQPEWGKQEEMMPVIINYVKNNPQWKISLQTHKYLNIP